ncbi:MAG: hypothetical protein ACOCVK_00365 [bacterium]
MHPVIVVGSALLLRVLPFKEILLRAVQRVLKRGVFVVLEIDLPRPPLDDWLHVIGDAPTLLPSDDERVVARDSAENGDKAGTEDGEELPIEERLDRLETDDRVERDPSFFVENQKSAERSGTDASR